MRVNIDLQLACTDPIPVAENVLIEWATLVLRHENKSAELSLRLVDEEEIRILNRDFRKEDKSTNVLAFPYTLPKGVKLDPPLIGDVVICPQVLAKESLTLAKPLKAHWAHIIIHGVLHLLSYNHLEDQEAAIMQTLETKLLATLGFANPYEEHEINYLLEDS